jgi:superfamily I DNA and RNA helicase
VAGSGKTSLIVDSLDLEKRSLLVTYTNVNLANLKHKIVNKFGYVPANIRVYSYFTFLYSFCYKPFLAMRFGSKGINWDFPPTHTRMLNRTDVAFYQDRFGRLYHNRIAKLLQEENILGDLNSRLERYFDNLYVDEVQDFAGYDFNLLLSLCQSKLKIMLVGDFFQHTYDTSVDGNVNKNLHTDYSRYQERFRHMGLRVDLARLNRSHRCSPNVCSFISDALGIEISSHRTDNAQVEILEDKQLVDEKFYCRKTVKLFYQGHNRYPCFSNNWGASKGEDRYEDVCVVLNPKSYKLLKSSSLHSLSASTKNKLYVACSRARQNLYFVSEDLVKKYRIQ